MNENIDVARVLGQAYWRQEFLKGNPEATADEIKLHLQTDWRESRKDYTKIGMQMLRALERQGYSIVRPDSSNADENDDPVRSPD